MGLLVRPLPLLDTDTSIVKRVQWTERGNQVFRKLRKNKKRIKKERRVDGEVSHRNPGKK